MLNCTENTVHSTETTVKFLQRQCFILVASARKKSWIEKKLYFQNGSGEGGGDVQQIFSILCCNYLLHYYIHLSTKQVLSCLYFIINNINS